VIHDHRHEPVPDRHGAILKYAVTTNVEGINLHTAGLVLIIVGAVGLVLGVYFLARGRWTDVPPPPPL
jgi:hypothetical protein